MKVKKHFVDVKVINLMDDDLINKKLKGHNQISKGKSKFNLKNDEIDKDLLDDKAESNF